MSPLPADLKTARRYAISCETVRKDHLAHYFCSLSSLRFVSRRFRSQRTCDVSLGSQESNRYQPRLNPPALPSRFAILVWMASRTATKWTHQHQQVIPRAPIVALQHPLPRRQPLAPVQMSLPIILAITTKAATTTLPPPFMTRSQRIRYGMPPTSLARPETGSR